MCKLLVRSFKRRRSLCREQITGLGKVDAMHTTASLASYLTARPAAMAQQDFSWPALARTDLWGGGMMVLVAERSYSNLSGPAARGKMPLYHGGDALGRGFAGVEVTEARTIVIGCQLSLSGQFAISQA